MKQMLRKSLSLVLSLALLLTLVPVSYADDVVTDTTTDVVVTEQAPANGQPSAPADELAGGEKPLEVGEQIEKVSVGGEATIDGEESVPAGETQPAGEPVPEAESNAVDESVEQVEKLTPAEVLAPTREEQVGVEVTPTLDIKTFSMSSVLSMPLVSNLTSQPGELSINKTATKKVGENLFDVELTINGKDKKESTDVILVIDRSGSMGASGYEDRMTPTKEAVKTFINKVMSENSQGQVNVGIMTFDHEVIYPKEMQLTNNKEELLKQLDNNPSFIPRGNTFTHMAFKTAREVLEKSQAKNKYIILLTDGLPSISYKLVDWNKAKEARWAQGDNIKFFGKNGIKVHPNDIPNNDWIITDQLNMSLVDYDTSNKNYLELHDKTDGTYTGAHIYNGDEIQSNLLAKGDVLIQMPYKYYNSDKDYFDPFLNLNNLYKAENKLIGDINAYAIGIDMFPTGMILMKDLVGEDNAVNSKTGDLAKIYEKMAGEILYAASNANITDPMGDEFSIVDSDAIKVIDKDGNDLDGVNLDWDEKNETIKVKIPKVTEALSPIKIKYQVRLDGKNAVSGEDYPTNGVTTIDYTDSDGNKMQKEFPMPIGSLKDARITTTYVLVDKDGNLIKPDGSGQPAMDLNDARIKTESKGYDLNEEIDVIAENFTKDGVSYGYAGLVDVKGTIGDFKTDSSPKKVKTSDTKNAVVYFAYQIKKKLPVEINKHWIKVDPFTDEEIKGQVEIKIPSTLDYVEKEYLEFYMDTLVANGTKNELGIKVAGSQEERIELTKEMISSASPSIWTIDNNLKLIEGVSEKDILVNEYLKIPNFPDIPNGKTTFLSDVKFENDKYIINGYNQIISQPITIKKEFKNWKKNSIPEVIKIKFTAQGKIYGKSGKIVKDGNLYAIEKELKIDRASGKGEQMFMLPSEIQQYVRDSSYIVEEVSEGKLFDGNSVTYVLDGKSVDKVSIPISTSVRDKGAVVEIINKKTAEPAPTYSYTVKYMSGDKKLRDDKVVGGQTMNETVTESAVYIAGYKVSGDTSKTITIAPNNKDNVITFYYRKIPNTGYNELPNDGGSTGGGSGGSGSSDTVETFEDGETPLGKLNLVDHNAYIQGYPDGTVQPQGLLTRQEVAAVFFRLLDKEYREGIRSQSNKFSDVKATRWSNKHISTLANGKIIKGYTDGTFRPDRNITRAELAVIASRFDKLEKNANHKFSDIKGHWAEKYIASAVKKGWVNGYKNGTFKPNEYITRAEFVSFVNNVLNRHVKEKDILKDARKFTDLEDKAAWYYCPMKSATNSYLYNEPENEEKNGNLYKFQKWTKIIKPLIEF